MLPWGRSSGWRVTSRRSGSVGAGSGGSPGQAAHLGGAGGGGRGRVFRPPSSALQSGRTPPVVLLGAVLFLECRRRGWPFLAGAATLLLAIKPHLAYLVWPAILCEAIARRQFAVVAGGLSAGVVAVLVPLAFDPRLVHPYA